MFLNSGLFNMFDSPVRQPRRYYAPDYNYYDRANDRDCNCQDCLDRAYYRDLNREQQRRRRVVKPQRQPTTPKNRSDTKIPTQNAKIAPKSETRKKSEPVEIPITLEKTKLQSRMEKMEIGDRKKLTSNDDPILIELEHPIPRDCENELTVDEEIIVEPDA